MPGNPCQANWKTGFREFVVASLPQLEILDGKETHRSVRIKALQVFRDRQKFVRCEAKTVHTKMELERKEENPTEEGQKEKKSVMASTEKVPYTPYTRREMYLEVAEQKEDEEARRRENRLKERNTEAEHEEALPKARVQEERGDEAIRQCNEGTWEFRLMDEILDVILEVDLPRFLDSSLVDVDVHPSYVSFVAKNKAHVTPTQQRRAQLYREEQEKKLEKDKSTNKMKTSKTTRTISRQSKISDELLEAAKKVPKDKHRAVNIRGLVKIKNGEDNNDS
ncbi:hypothetical protein PF010_g2774 [Phytophthora fragariae]|uniref:Dynein axonemal assembly factor 11-like CS domain-containing protein n=1 Tax=Phytophthora fragariae TaxID=53985 RepID=A0A6G0LW37_9STRA|nr:hypothetical protein PF010_g2774 [Phytophthora fragariae]